MKIGEYLLSNEEKLSRAINGRVTRNGKMEGGVGADAPEEAILAEYDRLGGYISKDGLKVKTGSFYNFSEKAALETPAVTYVTEFEGEMIEVTEDEAKAIDKTKKKKEAVRSKARSRKKKSK